jgi:predicted amidophosphoribosyltransferase
VNDELGRISKEENKDIVKDEIDRRRDTKKKVGKEKSERRKELKNR